MREHGAIRSLNNGWIEHLLDTARGQVPAPQAPQEFDEFMLERQRAFREGGKETETLRSGAKLARS